MKRKTQTNTISYKLQDSTRFMASSLSNRANSLPKGIYKIKNKYRHYDKKFETTVIKYKDCD